MKRIYSAAASVALMIFSVSLGQAASKPTDSSPAVQARTMLQEIDSWSDKIALTKLPVPDQQQQRILDALKVSLPSK